MSPNSYLNMVSVVQLSNMFTTVALAGIRE